VESTTLETTTTLLTGEWVRIHGRDTTLVQLRGLS